MRTTLFSWQRLILLSIVLACFTPYHTQIRASEETVSTTPLNEKSYSIENLHDPAAQKKAVRAWANQLQPEVVKFNTLH